MDAIVSTGRKGIKIDKGCTLYTTTFPCHLCAHHIIAAGIEKVVYIEPYEKSLATELHFDSMSLLPSPNRLHIKSFQGVSPKRYQVFCKMSRDRKKDGKAVNTNINELSLIDVHHVVSMLELELKCTKDLQEKRQAG